MSRSGVGREISALVNDRRKTGRSMYGSKRSVAMSGAGSVMSDEVLQRRLALENYKEESAARMVAGKYKQAVDMYTKVGRRLLNCILEVKETSSLVIRHEIR